MAFAKGEEIRERRLIRRKDCFLQDVEMSGQEEQIKSSLKCAAEKGEKKLKR